MAPAAQALASSLSISPQPVTPASVEILTNTQVFFRTKVSILVTLTLSLGPTAAALVRSQVNRASKPYSAPDASAPRSRERRLNSRDIKISPGIRSPAILSGCMYDVKAGARL